MEKKDFKQELQKGGTVVSAHQPGYFPWLGYLHKIYCADIFIFMDHVAAGKGNYISRCQIRNENGPCWMSVPLRCRKCETPVMDLQFADNRFIRTHLRMLRFYGKTPFFRDFFPEVEDIMQAASEHGSLCRLNMDILTFFMDILSIKTPIVKSSGLDICSSKARLIIDMVKAVGGKTYFSGSLAGCYQKEEDFQGAGLRLVYQDWYGFQEKNNYLQFHAPALNGLSALDALFNIGPEGIRELFAGYNEKR
jgi:hypothetical protein